MIPRDGLHCIIFEQLILSKALRHMKSRRRRVITIGVLLAAVGACIPIALMSWLAIKIASQNEQALLSLVAQRTLAQAQRTFDETRRVLIAMETAHLAPCSDAHIARMRGEALNSIAVDEIGFFEEGVLKCTSWGRTTRGYRQTPADYVRTDGVGVTLRVRPYVSVSNEMIAMQLGQHNALVLPTRFVDDTNDATGIDVVLLTTHGQVLATSRYRAATADGTGGHNMQRNLVSNQVANGGLVVVASESRAALRRGVMHELVILLPIGLFLALFIVGLIVWLSRRRLSPQAELELAVRKREFFVEYQPIVALRTGICVGAEALVRWRRPDGAVVRPDLFIPLAEETGLIRQITDQVIDIIIADLCAVLITDRTLHIAINVCADDIQSGRILPVIAEKLHSSGIHTQQIWLEATERGFMDVETAQKTLAMAREAGHSVAIDDFGTGYSSLQYLQRLPLDALKIDRSFVDTIGRDTATSSVVLHIIKLARDLGLFSVAEGVETEAQLQFLKDQGVDFGQGWLFGKPLSASGFLQYHARQKLRFGAAPEVIQVGHAETGSA
jgi:sensor c-di-GMP phosphodiesterase-like protein